MAGSDTASMVPGRYDCVIDGYGFMFDRRGERRAQLGYTPTFLERQNVSGAYGDNEQEFFLTVSQKDWTGGEGQRFFRANDDESSSRYFHAVGTSVAIQGEASPDFAVSALTPTVNFLASTAGSRSETHYLVTSSNLYTFDGTSFSDAGAHGAGTPNKNGMCVDSSNVYIAGSTDIRRWDGASFTSFCTDNNAGALAYLNNALYSCDGSVLKTYDTAGVASTLYTWQNAQGTAFSALGRTVRLFTNGPKLLIFFASTASTAQLWEYDGTGTTLIAELPVGALGGDALSAEGVVYMSALLKSTDVRISSSGLVAAVYALVNGTLAELWRSDQTNTNANAYPVLGVFAGRLVFAEFPNASGDTPRLKQYDPQSGAITTLSEFTVTATAGSYQMSSSFGTVLLSFDNGVSTKKAFSYPSGSVNSTSTLFTSQFDFGNALTKTFRGVIVDFEGGGVDVAYQLNGVGGSYTSLATGITSGTEVLFSAGTTGRTVSLRLTVSSGAYVKRIYVRAAPMLQSYRKAVYVLDCSGRNGEQPVMRRDGTPHNLDGVAMLTNLRAAIGSAVSITDHIGTYTGIIEAGGFTADVVNPEEFVVTVPCREI